MVRAVHQRQALLQERVRVFVLLAGAALLRHALRVLRGGGLLAGKEPHEHVLHLLPRRYLFAAHDYDKPLNILSRKNETVILF